MDSNKVIPLQNGDESDFYMQVADLLAESRKYAKKQLDNTIAITYFEVGRMIVEREQRGQKRAQYGVKLIKGLSAHYNRASRERVFRPNLKKYKAVLSRVFTHNKRLFTD